MTAGDDRLADTGALIREVEGHLLIEAARAEGRAEAARFIRPLDWLTEAEREVLRTRYADHHLALTRRSWERTARRSTQLRAEYEALYRALRRRLYSGAALVTTFAVILLSTLACAVRHG